MEQFRTRFAPTALLCLAAFGCGSEPADAPEPAAKAPEAPAAAATPAPSLPGTVEDSPAKALFDAALAHYAKQELPAGIQKLEEAIAQDPTVPAFYAQLGAGHEETGEFDLAMEAYSRGLKQESVKRDANLWYRAGYLYARGRDYKKSIASLTNANRLDPENTTTLVTLGMMEMAEGAEPSRGLVFDRGAVERAASRFGEALELEPELAPAKRNLGLAQTLLGDLAAGEASLRAALKLDPSLATARMYLVQNLLAQERHADASAELEPLDANDGDPAVARFVVLQRAREFAAQQLWLESLQVLGPYLTRVPTDTEAFIEYQVACIQVRDSDSGRAALQMYMAAQTGRLGPNAKDLRDAARQSYEEAVTAEALGETERAMAGYHASLEIYPLLPQPYKRFGKLAADRGDEPGYVRALAWYETAVAIDPLDRDASMSRDDAVIWLGLDQ